MSKLGLKWSVLYFSWAAVFAALATITSDVKGNVAFLDIGILPQIMLLSFPGGLSWAKGVWWGWVYLVLVPPFMLILYLAGAWRERKLHRG